MDAVPLEGVGGDPEPRPVVARLLGDHRQVPAQALERHPLAMVESLAVDLRETLEELPRLL